MIVVLFVEVRGVYYESIKRELIRPILWAIYECRCDERLRTKTKEFCCLLLIRHVTGPFPVSPVPDLVVHRYRI
jgi:hypothetical protein